MLFTGTFLDGERLGKGDRRQLKFDDSVITLGLSPLKFKIIGMQTLTHANDDYIGRYPNTVCDWLYIATEHT